jgi:hypothetical protein
LLVIGDVMLDEFVWERFPGFPGLRTVVEVQSDPLIRAARPTLRRLFARSAESVRISGGWMRAPPRAACGLLTAGTSPPGSGGSGRNSNIVGGSSPASGSRRVDRERRLPLRNSAHDAVLGQLPGMLHGVDGVIFGDYNKDFSTGVSWIASAHGR